ncbi:DUF722 domain-containing protein [Leuconostoc carnosum]|uniref:DUF722 domain-containing protein n=1 Tax=Leuconostoc carnosum TaxID=1252 RepID=UPI0012392CEF|nr:DUF722 domain-containing protein [Leuconostoc carnosum]KAA8373145.1 DUF722 domain-containing protein [Leuconostoc carnosum]
MADKTDGLLTDYYSGVIDMKILLRRSELQWQPHDENIGGGRALNKHTRPVDDLIIKYESDGILHELVKQRDAIKRLETTFSEETKQVVQMHYDRRECLSWVVISMRMNLSERTCRNYRKSFKDIVAEAFAELDIAV